MKRTTPKAVEISRQTLESVARIFGPTSAAQLALDEADKHVGPVRFIQVGATILVERGICEVCG